MTNPPRRARTKRTSGALPVPSPESASHDDASPADVVEATVRILIGLVEARHYETARHVERVSFAAGLIARSLELDDERSLLIERASTLHDVGKLGLPDRVLLKRDALTSDEREKMKLHATIGHGILSGTGIPLLETAATIAWTHHERLDGSGYPRGLRGPEIPLEGRITAVADVFDALTSFRPYRPAYPIPAAIRYLHVERGRLFDADAVDVFEASLDRILALRGQAVSVRMAPIAVGVAAPDEAAFELA